MLGASTPWNLDGLQGRDPWFYSHFIEAVDVLDAFLGGDGLSIRGARVADIGCGDGLIDLGLALRLQPAQLVGIDVNPTDVRHLAAVAARAIGVETLPDNLEFRTSGERTIPCDDATFDWVISWSAFEHISDPEAVLREVRRILRPDGCLFIQLYPFYDSEWGSHLEHWYKEPFVQHRVPSEVITAHVRANPHPDDPNYNERMIDAFETLNGLTLNGLQQALRACDFSIAKAELYTSPIHIPNESQDIPLTDLLISGIKLLALPM